MADFTDVGVGSTQGTDVGDKTFYGMRLDPATGNLFVDVICDGSDPIKLPDPTNVSVNDYRQYVFAEETLDFKVSDQGNLLVTVY